VKKNKQLKPHGGFGRHRHSVYNGKTQIIASFMQRIHFLLQLAYDFELIVELFLIKHKPLS
jgi:hypothetical protein